MHRRHRRPASFSETTTHGVTFDLDLPCGPKCTATHTYRKPCEEGRTWREHRTEYNVELDVDYYFERDGNYGADADGRHGISVDGGSIEGWRITKCERYAVETRLRRAYGWLWMRVWRLFRVSLPGLFSSDMTTVNMDTLPPAERALILTLTEHNLRDWEPEPEDRDDDGPDYKED